MKKEQIAIYVIVAIIAMVLLFQFSSAFADSIRCRLGGICGNKDGGEAPPPPPPSEPPSVQNTGVEGLTDQQANTVGQLARRLHTDMDGIAYPGSRDKEAYAQLLELEDPMFTAVYNYFNHLYYSEGEGTLREWIGNENFWFTFSIVTPWGLYDGTQTKRAILERMDILGLS